MRYRITVRGRGTELRGYTDEFDVIAALSEALSDFDVLVVTSVAADDYDPFNPPWADTPCMYCLVNEHEKCDGAILGRDMIGCPCSRDGHPAQSVPNDPFEDDPQG